MGHFERKFKYMWMSPAIHLWTVGLRSDVATTLPLDVFTRRNIVADLFDRSWILLKKQQNRVLCHSLGDVRVTYTVHLRFVGKHVADFLLVLIELFSPPLTVEAL